MKENINSVYQTEKTIHDFGEQWKRYTKNENYYGSDEVFQDILSPLLDPKEITGKKVADVGSGTGRIVQMLARYSPKSLLSIEPSSSIEIVKKNTQNLPVAIDYLKASGENIPPQNFDFVFSIGVIHHIPDPEPVITAIYRSLKPGGTFFMWVYAREGNGFYLSLYNQMSKITKNLPDSLLIFLCWILVFPITLFGYLCYCFPLPMKRYMTQQLMKLKLRDRVYTIFDQLNPCYAKYYTQEEALSLLAQAQFFNIKIHHRHKYSWSVLAQKPLVGHHQ